MGLYITAENEEHSVAPSLLRKGVFGGPVVCIPSSHASVFGVVAALYFGEYTQY